jgi:hypothetical protein
MPADELTIDQLLEYVTIAIQAAGFTYVKGLRTQEKSDD